MTTGATLRREPRLVTLEGGEGAGKSTVLAALRAELERDVRVTCTREPGGTPLAEQIRTLLLDPTHEPPCDRTELLLMFASRAQLVAQVITPALERGDWVLSDRFTDASHAYQGGGRGCDPRLIDVLEHEFVGIEPGLTLLLDVPVDVGLARARGRGGSDRIESERLEFFERVRSAYLRRAAAQPSRFFVIDATQPPAAVAEHAVDALRRYRERSA
ncbi:dTMP kinase [Cognatilysobacter lacus]|uniref:Thymidylate kinase n=1 Tax=Cognatilysobacter lacus TaxID=1643323 RepID=A0A5D8Z4S6_9GAMM|nr:dTMP kinase [Lysobacter lacus]TZF89640.1 dTMP kinase [Lysobacter lacus]